MHINANSFIRKYNLIKTNPMTKIVVLGSDYCPFCNKVSNYFQKNNIPFEYIDTETPEGAEKRK